MTWTFSTEFERKGSRKIKRAIEEEFDSGGGFSTEKVGLLRTKLRYLPVMMWTAMTGCLGHSAERIVERKNLDHPIFKEIFYRPLHEGENWQKKDEETYNWLFSKLPTNLKLVRCIHGDAHIAWPMWVFDIERVKGEVDFLATKPFLTTSNEYDKKIGDKFGSLFSVGMPKGGEYVTLHGDEAINMITKHFGKLFDHNINVYKKFNTNFWFTIYYS